MSVWGVGLFHETTSHCPVGRADRPREPAQQLSMASSFPTFQNCQLAHLNQQTRPLWRQQLDSLASVSTSIKMGRWPPLSTVRLLVYSAQSSAWKPSALTMPWHSCEEAIGISQVHENPPSDFLGLRRMPRRCREGRTCSWQPGSLCEI